MEICDGISIRQEDVRNRNPPEKESVRNPAQAVSYSYGAVRKTAVEESEQVLPVKKPVVALALNRKTLGMSAYRSDISHAAAGG